jgi:hypothetical protein
MRDVFSFARENFEAGDSAHGYKLEIRRVI